MNFSGIEKGTRSLLFSAMAAMIFGSSAQAQSVVAPGCEVVTITGTVLLSKESLQSDAEEEQKFVCDRPLEGACPRGKEMLENDPSKWNLKNSEQDVIFGATSGTNWGRECLTKITCCDRPLEDPAIYSSFYEPSQSALGGGVSPQSGQDVTSWSPSTILP